MKNVIKFDCSRFEHGLIEKIVDRAEKMKPEGMRQSRMDWFMDITACHANGCQLKLDELLVAADFDFAHDVFGIRRHIDRTTGRLGDCFLPRFAMPGEEVSHG